MKELVGEVIVNQLRPSVLEKDVQLESNLVEDLGADSLDIVEITMAIEDLLDIEIYDEEMWKISTVEELINLVKGKI